MRRYELGRLAQLVRAARLHRAGHPFEPDTAHLNIHFVQVITIGRLAVCALLCTAASLTLASEGGVASTKPPYPFFAFQNGLAGVPLEGRPKLLKELGYDGMEFQTPERTPEMLKALDAQGLKLFSLYTTVWLTPEKGKPPYDPSLKTAIQLLKGRDTQIWLPIVGGTPSGTELDDRAVALVREIADLADKSGLRVALYPHAAIGSYCVTYVQTVEDAIRLIRKNRPQERRHGLQFEPLSQAQRRKKPGTVFESHVSLSVVRQHQRGGRWPGQPNPVGPLDPNPRSRQLRRRPCAEDA